MVLQKVRKRLFSWVLKYERKFRPLREFRRWLTRYNAEIFLVSYPKSGRTWARFVLGRVIQRHYDLAQDDMKVLTSDLMVSASNQRMKVTHDFGARKDRGYSGMSKQGYKGKRVILLSRDIRDTLVSYYYHVAKRNQQFDGTLSDFVRSEVFGARKIALFYKSWQQGHTLPAHFVHIRYEDMHTDAETCISQMLKVMGVEGVSPEHIRASVEEGHFDNMKQIETGRKTNFQGLNVPEQTAHDPNAVRVRRGKVGSYQDELTPDDLAYIDNIVQEVGVAPEWVYYTPHQHNTAH